MNLETVRKQANKLFNECSKFGSSYRSVLNSMYETASERKNYLKCSLIQDLIIEDILYARNRKAREQAKQKSILTKLEAERDKEISKHLTEFEVKKQVLLIGGEAALNNCIFYNHSQTLSFNWKSYDMISEEQYKYIADNIALPDGVKIEDNKGRK